MQFCNVFLIACLGKAYAAGCKSMTQRRIKRWKKTGVGNSMKRCNLPPTSEATVENIRRSHYQVALWLNSMSGILSPLRPTDFGWEQDGLVLKSRTVTQGITVAPDDILEMVRCGCVAKSDVLFCSCEAGPLCLNPLTKKAVEGDEDNDVDDEQYLES